MESVTLRIGSSKNSILSRLDSRDVALWVSSSAVQSADTQHLAAAIRLPWTLVIAEGLNGTLDSAVTAPEPPDDSKVVRRGYPIIVDVNPTEMLLPLRSLPIYKLDEGERGASQSLATQLKRLNILDALKRAAPRELVVLVGTSSDVPSDVKALWSEGYRPLITVVGTAAELYTKLDEWRQSRASGGPVGLAEQDTTEFCQQLTSLYDDSRSGERQIVRIRNVRGEFRKLDVTGIDDPQHPVLARYELLQDGALQPLLPQDLTQDEVQTFFRDPSDSWRPYAANLPWPHGGASWSELRKILRQLDHQGSESNTVAYIRAESGAGGTTLSRSLAWQAAAEGYPTLFARQAPFTPTSLEVTGLMTRLIERSRSGRGAEDSGRLYETPWLIVFDRNHWEGRNAELRTFMRGLEQSGRSACILLANGPYLDLDFLSIPRTREIARLTHEVPVAEAQSFGDHINRFLAPHGPIRTTEEWQGFFHASTVHAESGISTFWIALSFWLQRQIDMTETVQSWLYKQFRTKIRDPQLQQALIDIAAMSTERRPLPDSMLPPTIDWPVSQKLEDIRPEIASLGLVRLRLEGDRYWALAHDILGRFLLRAIYDDPEARAKFGFKDATNSEHLRFLVLKRLSTNSAMALTTNRAIAEDFAVSIFKIDPDHGHATFAPFWSEALATLDAMPQILWRTSRTLRHHSAISRRRIAKDKDLFQVDANGRIALLQRAIEDIQYAITSIPRSNNDESDLNLYNSLARAYQDLHAEAADNGASIETLERLRSLAYDATRRAFHLNPDSPFVVETYARNLLAEAKTNSLVIGQNAIEVLNLVFSEMERSRSEQRRFELSRLAEAAIALLVSDGSSNIASDDSEVGIIVSALRALTKDVQSLEGLALSEFPTANRHAAAEYLSNPNVRGNLQAVRMLYALKCIDAPQNFDEQLGLLEALQSGGYPVSPQYRLELAILLQQRGRFEDGNRIFQQLRPLWRTGEYFVQVPERLRWLLGANSNERLLVSARVEHGTEARGFAAVSEMRNLSVPFRAVEFGQRELPPRTPIKGYISFGHNGPFLRPTTAVRS
jgi:hypothetical protein